MKIEIPYNVTNVRIFDTGKGWAVSFETARVNGEESAEQAGAAAESDPRETDSSEAPAAAPTAAPGAEPGAAKPAAAKRTETAAERAERIRQQNRERQARKRQRDALNAGGVTSRVTERDNGVTSRVTERDSIQGVDCLIDGFINYSQENINKNQSIKQETKYQRSAARCVTSRVTERDSVTGGEESEQLFLNIDYPLPPKLDAPEIREAWEEWIQKRRQEWGIYRISTAAIHEILDMMETAYENGGTAGVIAVIRYNIEHERKNRWQRPAPETDHKATFYRYFEPEPAREPETEEERAENKRIIEEVFSMLKKGRGKAA